MDKSPFQRRIEGAGGDAQGAGGRVVVGRLLVGECRHPGQQVRIGGGETKRRQLPTHDAHRIGEGCQPRCVAGLEFLGVDDLHGDRVAELEGAFPFDETGQPFEGVTK